MVGTIWVSLFGFEGANFDFASYLIPPLRVIPRANVSPSQHDHHRHLQVAAYF